MYKGNIMTTYKQHLMQQMLIDILLSVISFVFFYSKFISTWSIFVFSNILLKPLWEMCQFYQSLHMERPLILTVCWLCVTFVSFAHAVDHHLRLSLRLGHIVLQPIIHSPSGKKINWIHKFIRGNP